MYLVVNHLGFDAIHLIWTLLGRGVLGTTVRIPTHHAECLDIECHSSAAILFRKIFRSGQILRSWYIFQTPVLPEYLLSASGLNATLAS